MLTCLKYLAPRAEIVRIQLEGVIADSWCPTILNGEVRYYEYENITMETPVGQDVIIF
jgi:hypothetical protein